MPDEQESVQIVPDSRRSQSVEIVTGLKDVVLSNDGNIVVSRRTAYFTDGQQDYEDVEYERIGPDDAIPMDALTLIRTRLGE